MLHPYIEQAHTLYTSKYLDKPKSLQNDILLHLSYISGLFLEPLVLNGFHGPSCAQQRQTQAVNRLEKKVMQLGSEVALQTYRMLSYS